MQDVAGIEQPRLVDDEPALLDVDAGQHGPLRHRSWPHGEAHLGQEFGDPRDEGLAERHQASRKAMIAGAAAGSWSMNM